MAHELPGNALAYQTPRTQHRKHSAYVPESHTLHVGPAACARRHALKALQQKDAAHLSYLNVTEADVASGGYEHDIVEAVGTLNATLPQLPRIYLIWVKCIDDLLGTDEDALISELETAYPDQRFALCHLDPIAGHADVMPGEKIQETRYRFIDAGQTRDNGVNIVGAWAPFDSACEINGLLNAWGLGPLRRLHECRTFDEYQDLGKSACTLALGFMGEYAARSMEERLGIPCCLIEPAFDPALVAKGYERWATVLGRTLPAAFDLAALQEEAHETLRAAARACDGRPVAIDASSTTYPLLLAKTLLEHGFNVTHVTARRVETAEEDAKRWIDERGGVQVLRAHNFRDVMGYPVSPESVMIGPDLARTLGIPRFVDMWHTEGYFGFHGIRKLAAAIVQASKEPTKIPGGAL